MPPVWNSYVSVADVDSSAARARELGADVHAPPFDVMDAGRMAVLRDPQGAFVMLWQPGTTFGAELVNAPGAWCWNELYTADTAPRPPSTAISSAGASSRSKARRCPTSW